MIDGPRPSVPDDIPDIIALVDAEMRAGSDQSLLSDYPLVYSATNLHNVRVIRVAGELASVVPVLPRRASLGGHALGVGIISPTATAVAHRHQGYASRCLASCIDAMRAARCELSVLWTQVETFPFYEQSGYHPVRYQATAYELRGADAARFSHDEHVRVTTLDVTDPDEVEAIRRMHDRDGDGIRRGPGDHAPLFSLPRMHTLLAVRDARPEGYLVVSDAINKPGFIEAGGDEAAIETLIRHALEALPSGARVDAHGNLTPTVLSTVLDQRVPERRRVVPAGMMIRINDLAGLLRAVDSPAADDALPGGVELTRQQWTAALFGSHAARPIPADAPPDLVERLGLELPLYLPIAVLDRS